MATMERVVKEEVPLPQAWGVLYAKPNPDGSRKRSLNCVAEDELVLIDRLPRRIGDVDRGNVLTREGWQAIDGQVRWPEQNVVQVRAVTGLAVRVTPEHLIHTDSGWVPAIDLKSGRKAHVLSTLFEVEMPKKDEVDRRDAFLMGAVTGDGWRVKHERGYGVGFGFCREMTEAFRPMLEYASERFDSRETVRPMTDNPDFFLVTWRTEKARAFMEGLDRNHVPTPIWRSSAGCAGAYLRGLFSTDGSVGSYKDSRTTTWNLQVTFCNTRKSLIDEVRMLLRMLGIPNTMNTLIRAPRYKDLFTISIGRKLALDRYCDLIGFADKHRQKMLEDGLMRKGEYPFIERVKSVTPTGTSKVVSISVPRTLSFYASGILVHNC